MKRLTTIIPLILLTFGLTFGQVDPEFKAALKNMFEVSGSEETYKTVIRQMVSMFKTQFANVPEGHWNDLENEFLQTSLDDLVDMLVPVYSKHLTLEDLQKIIEFYHTPTGKKYAEKTPLITQESMQIGQQWGMQIGQDFQNKLKEKGY
ncbi:MAG: DUF2059 domain-containing protein [Bacteroidales bacterium]|nr:MAG: DUF2059 domain-containing protein [Bacteroidales bacterium]